NAEAEASGWTAWLETLHSAGRAVLAREGGMERWFATEASRDPHDVLRGRLAALGPVLAPAASAGPGWNDSGAPLSVLATDEAECLLLIEAEGFALRCRIAGRDAWCERRLLARIHRYTLERLRREIEPVSAQEFWRFLTCWQHAEPSFR